LKKVLSQKQTGGNNFNNFITYTPSFSREGAGGLGVKKGFFYNNSQEE
jgi:hypothetical protein